MEPFSFFCGISFVERVKMNNLIFEFAQNENSYVHFKKEEKSQKQK